MDLLGTQVGLNSGGGGQLQSGAPNGQSSAHTAWNSTIWQTSLKGQPPEQTGAGKVGSVNEIMFSFL